MIKINKQDETADTPQLQRNIHAGVLTGFTLNSNTDRSYRYKKVRRPVAIEQLGRIKMPRNVDEKVSDNGVVFYPECLEYIFKVEGIAKKLLLFVAFHQLNPQDNTFLFNEHTIANFNRYCMACADKPYKKENIKQMLRKELVNRNIILNVSKGKYMLNPMIGGCNSLQTRRTLIAEYSNRLIKKGKDPYADFYPKY